MRIRIRFMKKGPIRYVGHLDFMRCFQKGIKKSGLPALYSAGFSPHMLMSFAAPLAIGEETEGDYVDVDFAYRDPFPLSEQELYRLSDMGLQNEELPLPPAADVFCRILDEAMPEGVTITGACRVGLVKGSKAMALVRYAAYELTLPCGETHPEGIAEKAEAYLARPEILMHKKTKTAEKDVDIRPLINSFSAERSDADGQEPKLRMSLVCASGSMQNLKPGAVFESFAAYAGLPFDPYDLRILRKDLYDDALQNLLALGRQF